MFLCVNFVEPPDESQRCQHLVNRADASPLVEVAGRGEEHDKKMFRKGAIKTGQKR